MGTKPHEAGQTNTQYEDIKASEKVHNEFLNMCWYVVLVVCLSYQRVWLCVLCGCRGGGRGERDGDWPR